MNIKHWTMGGRSKLWGTKEWTESRQRQITINKGRGRIRRLMSSCTIILIPTPTPISSAWSLLHEQMIHHIKYIVNPLKSSSNSLFNTSYQTMQLMKKDKSIKEGGLLNHSKQGFE